MACKKVKWQVSMGGRPYVGYVQVKRSGNHFFSSGGKGYN